MKNKKAISLPITILVILVLVLVGFTLFSMISGTGGLKKGLVTPAYIFESVSSQEEQLGFYSKQILELAFVKTYYGFASGNRDEFIEFIQNWQKIGFSYDVNYFKSEFEKELIENINEINNKIDIANFEEFSEIKNKIKEGDFNINLDDAISQAKFSTQMDLSIDLDKDLGIGIVYDPVILAGISAEELKLHSFQEIFDKIKMCKGEENINDIKNCFRLKHFNVDVGQKDNNFNIKLTSKKKFLIDNELKKIELRFELWRK